MSVPARFTSEELEAAFEIVADNEGCAGADGVTIDAFEGRLEAELKRLIQRVADGSYRAVPLLKILLEKKPGSTDTRRLLVPSVRDRVLQTAVARRLSKSYEEAFLESSFAYRPGRSVDRAVARVQQLRDAGFTHVVDADISSFFDEVSHGAILSIAAEFAEDRSVLPLLHDWIRGEYWDGERVRRLTKGLPQGSPISPLLANLFLHGFDAEMEKGTNHLARYADDFLILCENAEAAEAALAGAARALGERGLRLNARKTRVTSFEEGFTWLGVYFTGNRVWIPWKEKRPQGRLLFAARPLPAHLLWRYEQGPPRGEMEEAFVRALVPAERTDKRGDEGGKAVAFLYLTEQGSILRKSGDRFLVEREDRIILDVPYHKLQQVLVFGNVQLTTQAMGELLDRGIRVSLLHGSGRYRGSLAAPGGKNVPLRMAQYQLQTDGERSLALARATIAAKVANAAAVLDSYARRQAPAGEYGPLRAALTRAVEDVGSAATLEAASGVEGAAARAYFSAVMMWNRSGFEWPGRVRRPPKDPVNALLSLTYTLVLQEIGGLIESFGLDTGIGFLHQPEYGRPSLALDVLEPFRAPVCDRLVLTLLNRRMFLADAFQDTGPSGVRLESAALRRFLEHYETWMRAHRKPGGSYRTALRREVEMLSGVLGRGGEWKPWRFGTAVEEECAT